MTNRSILITGGAGSIGANLVRLPSDEGYQVRVDVFVLDSVRMQDGRGMVSDVARERVGGMTGRARWSW